MLLLFALAPAAATSPVAAQAVWWEEGPPLPRLTGRVVDEAGLLPPAVHVRLARQLAQFERTSGHQLVIVTVRSLQGQSIETFGVRLGRTWQIGRRGVDDGILLIVAPNERKVRIEVGYGLDKLLGDATCGRIIARLIAPAFKKGDLAGGIEAGTRAVIARLSRPPVIVPPPVVTSP